MGDAVTIELPFPSSDLSPNKRLHWAKKAKAVKKARNDARIACMAAGARGLGWPAAIVTVTFHEPDNRQRDMDGMSGIECGMTARQVALVSGTVRDSVQSFAVFHGISLGRRGHGDFTRHPRSKMRKEYFQG